MTGGPSLHRIGQSVGNVVKKIPVTVGSPIETRLSLLCHGDSLRRDTVPSSEPPVRIKPDPGNHKGIPSHFLRRVSSTPVYDSYHRRLYVRETVFRSWKRNSPQGEIPTSRPFPLPGTSLVFFTRLFVKRSRIVKTRRHRPGRHHPLRNGRRIGTELPGRSVSDGTLDPNSVSITVVSRKRRRVL